MQRESQIAKELIVVRQLEVDMRTLRRDICTAKDIIDREDRLDRAEVGFLKQDLQDRLKELTRYRGRAETLKLKDAGGLRHRLAELEQAGRQGEVRDGKAPAAVIDWPPRRGTGCGAGPQQMEASLLNERTGDLLGAFGTIGNALGRQPAPATPAETRMARHVEGPGSP